MAFCVLCRCAFDKCVSGCGYNRRLLSCKLRRSQLTVIEVLKNKFNYKVCCVHSSADFGINMWALRIGVCAAQPQICSVASQYVRTPSRGRNICGRLSLPYA